MPLSFASHLFLTASMIGNASICSTSPPGNAIRTGSLASPRDINAFSGLSISTEAARRTKGFLFDSHDLFHGPRVADARIRETHIVSRIQVLVSAAIQSILFRMKERPPPCHIPSDPRSRSRRTKISMMGPKISMAGTCGWKGGGWFFFLDPMASISRKRKKDVSMVDVL